MFCEKIKIPGLPGEGTVTDGSVDWYEMDWENVDNGDRSADCNSGAAACFG